MKNLILILGSLALLALPSQVLAYEPDTDCVIQDFNSTVTLNKDSSAHVEETLRVDCGTLESKHGIFRILPTKVYRGKNIYPFTPITLDKITDENGKDKPFTTIVSRLNNTLTWKIGDPNVTISGINVYKISYHIKNVMIPSDNGNALYLNLNGSFWELPINNFSAIVNLPEGISKDNTNIKIYSGEFGSAENELAKYVWNADGRSFNVTASEVPTNFGITTWAEFPFGIVKLYKPNWFQLYGNNLWFLAILFFFWWAYGKWKAFGKDPKAKGPLVAEYDPPKDLLPMEAGLLNTYGALSPVFISATIVDLAVRGYIKIEEVQTSGLFADKDWKIIVLKNDVSALKYYEQKLLTSLFDADIQVGDTTTIVEQKNKFYIKMPAIRDGAYENIKNLFDSRGTGWQILFLVLGFMGLVGSIPLAVVMVNWQMGVALFASSIILIVFGILMPKRSAEGASVFYGLQGFRLYMKEAEKYRMRFYEKEGIFEKYLPYAIVFGLTAIWAKAFASVYQEKTGSAYVPFWYVGMNSGGGFDAESFSSHLSSMSSSMAATLASSPSSSGSGGGGFSGGGAGGGGGGSW